MSFVISAAVLVCALAVLLRTLCVLDHMDSRTGWLIQIVYALQAGGAAGMAFAVLVGSDFSPGSVALLIGVAASHVCDRRIYPPRVKRFRGGGRRKNDDFRGIHQ